MEEDDFKYKWLKKKFCLNNFVNKPTKKIYVKIVFLSCLSIILSLVKWKVEKKERNYKKRKKERNFYFIKGQQIQNISFLNTNSLNFVLFMSSDLLAGQKT